MSSTRLLTQLAKITTSSIDLPAAARSSAQELKYYRNQVTLEAALAEPVCERLFPYSDPISECQACQGNCPRR